MQLRPYQSEAVESIERELCRVRSTLLVLATGLGKTVTFGACAARVVATGGRVLVLAHRGELLEQATATLVRFGLSTGIEQGAKRVSPNALPDVVVASVATLRGKRLHSFPADAFALIVVDEAHHTPAESYRAVLEHFATAKVLGVTATPDRGDGVALGSVFESCAYRMDIAQGIEAGWLAPLELRSVVVDALDISKVRSVAGDLAAGDLERELMRDGVLHQVAAPLAELCADRQTLVFTAGVQQAHALAAMLESYGVRAAAVDGSMPREKRAEVLEAFRSGRVQVVCNAQLWTEGFDAPETSCVALVRPTRSRALLCQMIGRGTRLAEGKRDCLVLDFEPGRASRMRLACPADVLAGDDLPDDLMAHIRALSRSGQSDLRALLEQAKAALAIAHAAKVVDREAEITRLVQRVGVAYAAPRLDVSQLLAATYREPPGWRNQWRRKPASMSQLHVLRKAGFDELPADLNHRQADALLEIVRKRRAAGLCTIKQARKLRSYGLRDDMSLADASQALAAISANGWRPPLWLFHDPRFVKDAAA